MGSHHRASITRGLENQENTSTANFDSAIKRKCITDISIHFPKNLDPEKYVNSSTNNYNSAIEPTEFIPGISDDLPNNIYNEKCSNSTNNYNSAIESTECIPGISDYLPNICHEKFANSTIHINSSIETKECTPEITNHLPIDVDPEKYLNSIKLKDSGYSWVVVAAMLLSNVLTAGYIKSFGIICNFVLDEFPDTSGSEAGLMISLLIGCRALLTPVAGALSVKFGSRVTMALGTLLCFTGFSTSFFSTSVWQFSITLGAIIGVGVCLLESTQVVILPYYFDKNLSFANGIRTSGYAIGGMVFPFILLLLTNYFGFRISRVLLGSIFLHIFICMALIRTPKTHKKIQILKILNNFNIEKSEKKKLYTEINNRVLNVMQKSNSKPLEYSYLKNGVYWLFIISSVSSTIALPNALQYIPIYSRSIGLSSDQISLLLSYQSLMEMTSCITIGFLSTRNIFKKLHGFIFCVCIGSIGIMFIPFCIYLWQIYLAAALLMVGGSSRLVLFSVILTEQFGKDSIATTWGFVRLGQGIFQFLSPPILGTITDVSGSYVTTFIVMGGGMLLSALLLLLEPIVIKITKSKIIIT